MEARKRSNDVAGKSRITGDKAESPDAPVMQENVEVVGSIAGGSRLLQSSHPPLSGDAAGDASGDVGGQDGAGCLAKRKLEGVDVEETRETKLPRLNRDAGRSAAGVEFPGGAEVEPTRPGAHKLDRPKTRPELAVSSGTSDGDAATKSKSSNLVTPPPASTLAIKQVELDSSLNAQNRASRPRGERSEYKEGVDREKEEHEKDDDDKDGDAEDNDDLDLSGMRQHEYEQVAKFDAAQLLRYEQYRRSDLKTGKIKKVLTAINPVLAKSSDHFLVAVKGLAKVFVGDVVETALEVREQCGDAGALQPKHLREAYRRLQRTGAIPTTNAREDGLR
jgi:transcription initiation factor TFIID subunit 11